MLVLHTCGDCFVHVDSFVLLIQFKLDSRQDFETARKGMGRTNRIESNEKKQSRKEVEKNSVEYGER